MSSSFQREGGREGVRLARGTFSSRSRTFWRCRFKNDASGESAQAVTRVHGAVDPLLLKDKAVNFNYRISSNFQQFNNSFLLPDGGSQDGRLWELIGLASLI